MMTASSAGSSSRMPMKIGGTTMLLLTTIAVMAGGNRLYSESGSFPAQSVVDESLQRSTTADAQQPEYFDTDYQLPNLYRTESLPAKEEEQRRQRLEKILEQLQQNENKEGFNFAEPFDEDAPVLNPQAPHQRNRNAQELAELRRLGTTIREMSKQQQQNEEFDEGTTKPAKIVAAPVKKGQNEFVEFVEPIQSNRLRNSEWVEKRVHSEMAYGDDDQRDGYQSPFKFFSNSGNALFVAYLVICCAGVIAGVVGGIYYYNHVRAARIDDPFNEFTRYSPSGPSKEKLKMGSKGAGGAKGFSQTGDDTLAYKAQLQHYQQQKQKILGMAPAGPTNDTMSDNEEDTDELEHNFSVFECPGLAPTGDVEIQNPNFVGDDENGNGGGNNNKEPSEQQKTKERVD